MKFFTFFAFFLFSIQAQSQNATDKNISFGLTGQVGASTDGKAVFVNLGGPNLKFETKIKRIDKNLLTFNVGCAMYPSLWYHPDLTGSKIRPTLGAGLFFSVQKTSLIIPVYYIAYPNEAAKWHITFGLAHRF
jgi:hypothetical protein